MIEIQNAQAVAALVEAFGLKGRYRLQLDEVAVPVAIVADVRASDIKGTGYQTTFVEGALAAESAVLRWTGTANFNALPLWVIVNPAGAGEARVVVNTTAVSSVLTGAATTGGVNRWNPQQPGAPAQAELGTVAGAMAGGIRGRHACAAGVDTFIDLTGLRATSPAVEIAVQFSVVNTAVTWTFAWDVEALNS